jgi:hypothetical protein
LADRIYWTESLAVSFYKLVSSDVNPSRKGLEEDELQCSSFARAPSLTSGISDAKIG